MAESIKNPGRDYTRLREESWVAMEETLKKNDHKEGWDSLGIFYPLRLLKDERQEVDEAFSKYKKAAMEDSSYYGGANGIKMRLEELRLELADEMNCAAMAILAINRELEAIRKFY